MKITDVKLQLLQSVNKSYKFLKISENVHISFA